MREAGHWTAGRDPYLLETSVPGHLRLRRRPLRPRQARRRRRRRGQHGDRLRAPVPEGGRAGGRAGAAGIRVLTWNLFHGRAVPAAGRPLAAEFARTLAGWEWDVALLQEVPPWWPRRLGAACGASGRMVLTSRNRGLFLRKALSARNPDLLTANGGGCNAILVRGHAIVQHRTLELTKTPERRTMHGVELGGGLGWVVNLHGSTHPFEQGQADQRLSHATALDWAGDGPLILGGDLNQTRPRHPGHDPRRGPPRRPRLRPRLGGRRATASGSRPRRSATTRRSPSRCAAPASRSAGRTRGASAAPSPRASPAWAGRRA